MTAGLQCFDAQGRLTFAATDRLARVLGYVSTGGQSGTTTHDGLPGNQPYFAFFPDYSSSGTRWPAISISGNTLSWSYSNASGNVPGFILFGIY